MSLCTVLFVGSLFFGCLMLVVGFVAGIWFAGPGRVLPSDTEVTDLAENHARSALQRARMFASSVIRVVQQVASEVSAHATKIEQVAADLCAADDACSESPAQIRAASERILAANLELQEQLTTAKQQIELQATQLRARESEARTDQLTMLFNRRAFEEELTRQLSIGKRKEVPFALLMLDLDHFKRHNDTHGHQSGDEVLREVAQLIVGRLRDMDIAFRYGGEEFAVILPAVDAGDACIVAERIRHTVEEAEVSWKDQRLRITTSVGVAPAIASDEFASIIRRADEALYGAKQSGRNCVRWHDGKDIRSLRSQRKPRTAEDPTSRPRQHSQPISFTTLHHELTRHVCDCRRYHTPLSVVCLRVDKRPAIDDDFDAVASDDVLIAVIELIRGRLEEKDLLVPVGMAEFILVLPGRGQGVATQLMDDAMDSPAGKDWEWMHHFGVRYEVCELLPQETAEQVLVRARQGALLTASSR